MSRPIPTTWDEIEPFLLLLLRTAMSAESANIKNKKPTTQVAPYRLLLVRGDLQQRVTPISRYARVGLTAWVVNAAGESDIPAARALVHAACAALEAAPIDGNPLLSAQTDAGPLRAPDPVTNLETVYATVLLEVHAA